MRCEENVIIAIGDNDLLFLIIINYKERIYTINHTTPHTYTIATHDLGRLSPIKASSTHCTCIKTSPSVATGGARGEIYNPWPSTHLTHRRRQQRYTARGCRSHLACIIRDKITL